MDFENWLKRRSIVAEIQFMLALEIQIETSDQSISPQEFLELKTAILGQILYLLTDLELHVVPRFSATGVVFSVNVIETITPMSYGELSNLLKKIDERLPSLPNIVVI